MSRFAVVIPSKTVSNLIPCMEAIWKNEAKDTPIVVVDDGLSPNDAQREIFRRFDKENCPLWISSDKPNPFVFAAAINKGIRKAAPLDVVITNDDAILETPDGFSILQQSAEEHPEYGIIGAVTNVTGQPLQQPQNIGLREVPHIAFVCVLIPRRTIEQIGLLDERYCLDYGVEDRDYCEAVTRAGLKVGVHDGCFVDHGSLVSTFRGDPKMPKSFARNYQLFKEKWGTA